MRLLASLIGFSYASLYPFEGLKREIFENHLKMWDTFRDPATGLYCDNVFSNSAHKCGNYLNAPWHANWYSSAATGSVARQLRKKTFARKDIFSKRQQRKRAFCPNKICAKIQSRKRTFTQKNNCVIRQLRDETITQRDNFHFWQTLFFRKRPFYANV